MSDNATATFPTNGATLEVGDVAALLHVHPATVRAWCRNGTIPAARLPNRWVIVESALREWLDRGGLQARAG